MKRKNGLKVTPERSNAKTVPLFVDKLCEHYLYSLFTSFYKL